MARDTREAPFAECPGSYEPAIRIRNPVINPGETLEVEVFITGYGRIGPSKLAFYPSPGIFNDRDSFTCFGIKRDGDLLTWGARQEPVGEAGCVIGLHGGVQVPEWDMPSFFVDLSDQIPPQILTETSQVNAPISFSLSTLPDAAPGTYRVQFYLTYYNGNYWSVAKQDVSSGVRSLLQRYEVTVAVIAFIAAAATILSGVVDIASHLGALFR